MHLPTKSTKLPDTFAFCAKRRALLFGVEIMVWMTLWEPTVREFSNDFGKIESHFVHILGARTKAPYASEEVANMWCSPTRPRMILVFLQPFPGSWRPHPGRIFQLVTKI